MGTADETLTAGAGAVEYTDCISAEGLDPAYRKSILDMTLKNLMVRLQ